MPEDIPKPSMLPAPNMLLASLAYSFIHSSVLFQAARPIANMKPTTAKTHKTQQNTHGNTNSA